MTYLGRLAACAAFSLGAHLVVAHGASFLPAQESRGRPAKIRVRVVEPPRAPDPDPEPPPPEPPPPEPVATPPEAVVVPKPRTPTRPAETPPTATPPVATTPPATPTGGRPRFGVSMESTSQGGSGPALPTGNSTARTPSGPAAPGGGGDPDAPPGPAAPAEAYEVSVMPLPRGRCSGAYTEAARQAAVEGTVILDLVVGADGRARNIKIVRGLGHGLDEAAVAALRACRFTPGERGGAAVPVRVREFKIRFFLQEN